MFALRELVRGVVRAWIGMAELDILREGEMLRWLFMDSEFRFFLVVAGDGGITSGLIGLSLRP
jgi:hypothetical protein